MAAPEFAQSDKLRRVFSALENRTYLGQLVGAVAGTGRVHVFIGAENASAEMHDVSLVLAPYGRPNRAVGVVGVLGPTRMPYPQAIGTVRFVSGLDERARRSPVRLNERRVHNQRCPRERPNR